MAFCEPMLFLAECGARRLPDSEVQSYDLRSLVAGWQVAIKTTVIVVRRIDIGVDDHFPFSLPHFFLVDRPPLLTWPHIEADGHLCLLDDTVVAKFGQPEAVIGAFFETHFSWFAIANPEQIKTTFVPSSILTGIGACPPRMRKYRAFWSHTARVDW